MTTGRREAIRALPGSEAGPLARALDWLWRPRGGVLGVGTGAEREALEGSLSAGEMNGLVILDDKVRTIRGEALFESGMRLRGEFGLLGDGEPWLRSSLGVHAAVRGRTLALAASADGGWGTLRFAWVVTAIARFCEERLQMKLDRIPPVGCLRIDDIPGTAEFQLEGRAKSDRVQMRLATRLAEKAAAEGAVLNIAVACRALGPDREVVPLEEVWPRATAALKKGVARGALEPVCHGWLGLVPAALERGEIDFHEYEPLSLQEARETLSAVSRWQEENLGPATTFVAVDWTYGEHARAAAAELGLVSWLPPEPGPLAEADAVRETLAGHLEGVAGVDLSPVTALAKAGVPPTVTLHGRSLDRRRETFRLPGDGLALARALIKRDIVRLLELDGVGWLGAGEFARRVQAHGRATALD